MRIKDNNLVRSIAIVWKSSPKWVMVNALVLLIRGVLPLLIIYIIKLLVDEVSYVLINGSLDQDYHQINQVLFLAGAIFLLNGVLSSISGILNEKLSFCINDAVHEMIHARSVSIEYSNFEDYNFQNIYHRAISEASYRPSKIYYGFIALLQNSITLILIGGLLATLQWYIILILIAVSLPIVLVRLRYSKKIYHQKREQTESEREVNYYDKLLTAKEFAKELRVFKLAKEFNERFESLKK